MREYLDYNGLTTMVSETKDHVKPWIGIDETSGSVSKYLNEQGIFSDVTVNTAVPDGNAGIISYTTIQLADIPST